MLKKILGLFLAVTITLASFSAFTSLALGVENQSNQGSDRLATLTAPSANFEISLYPKPDTKLDRLGYGLSGDGVTILEQMASNKDFSWYRVRFNNPPYVEGWIRGDYLVFINQDSGSVSSLADKNRYLGNQSPKVNTQKNRQASQQGNQRQYNNYPQK
jgi:hypothetical protein